MASITRSVDETGTTAYIQFGFDEPDGDYAISHKEIKDNVERLRFFQMSKYGDYYYYTFDTDEYFIDSFTIYLNNATYIKYVGDERSGTGSYRYDPPQTNDKGVPVNGYGVPIVGGLPPGDIGQQPEIGTLPIENEQSEEVTEIEYYRGTYVKFTRKEKFSPVVIYKNIYVGDDERALKYPNIDSPELIDRKQFENMTKTSETFGNEMKIFIIKDEEKLMGVYVDVTGKVFKEDLSYDYEYEILKDREAVGLEVGIENFLMEPYIEFNTSYTEFIPSEDFSFGMYREYCEAEEIDFVGFKDSSYDFINDSYKDIYYNIVSGA